MLAEFKYAHLETQWFGTAKNCIQWKINIIQVIDNRWIKVRETGLQGLNKSKQRVCHILKQNFVMKKRTAYCVPRLLTPDQNHVRLNIFNAITQKFNAVSLLSELYKSIIVKKDKPLPLHYKQKTEIVKKRSHLPKKILFFHRKIAPPHTFRNGMAKIYELQFELFDQPPYSEILPQALHSKDKDFLFCQCISV